MNIHWLYSMGKILDRTQVVDVKKSEDIDACDIPKITNFILGGPDAIVVWEDNTKTDIKYTELEKALCEAICRRLYSSDFDKEFTKYLNKVVSECVWNALKGNTIER